MYAEEKDCIGNINAKQLIINELRLRKRQFELASDEAQQAVNNDNREGLLLKYSKAKEFNGMVWGLTYALRYILAEEAEASGRQVSAGMSEFTKVIEDLVYGEEF